MKAHNGSIRRPALRAAAEREAPRGPAHPAKRNPSPRRP